VTSSLTQSVAHQESIYLRCTRPGMQGVDRVSLFSTKGIYRQRTRKHAWFVKGQNWRTSAMASFLTVLILTL